MKVVVVGSGAREHALAWALSHSAEVLVAPGSDAIAATGLAVSDLPATELEADLFVIGPEQPLVDGLADALRAQGKTVFGPGADGARLEGSKAYLKEFLAAAGVPSARYGSFSDERAALDFLESMTPPYVVKTDGLAAGKGVLVTNSLDEAREDVRAKLAGTRFEGAGATVVIEEHLAGRECSVMILTDGTRAWAMVPARDYKRVGDADTGPNTGGMGAVAPVDDVDEVTIRRIDEEIARPTIAELKRRGIEYRGVLYAGVMVTEAGPKLIEYNVRFGDPEAQVLSVLYRDRLLGLLNSCAQGHLESPDVSGGADLGAAVTVVLAAEGYPGEPRRGDVITGLDESGQLDVNDVVVFHGGTKRAGRDFVTNGGRVISVTASGADVATARRRAYDAVDMVDFAGRIRRRDIAEDGRAAQ